MDNKIPELNSETAWLVVGYNKNKTKYLLVRYSWFIKERFTGLNLESSKEVELSNGNMLWVDRLDLKEYDTIEFIAYNDTGSMYIACIDISIYLGSNIRLVLKTENYNLMACYRTWDNTAILDYRISNYDNEKIKKMQNRVKLLGSSFEVITDGVNIIQVGSYDDAMRNIETGISNVLCNHMFIGTSQNRSITANNQNVFQILALNISIDNTKNNHIHILSDSTYGDQANKRSVSIKVLGDTLNVDMLQGLPLGNIKAKRVTNTIVNDAYIDLSGCEYISPMGVLFGINSNLTRFIDFKDSCNVVSDRWLEERYQSWLDVYIYAENDELAYRIKNARRGEMGKYTLVTNRDQWLEMVNKGRKIELSKTTGRHTLI